MNSWLRVPATCLVVALLVWFGSGPVHASHGAWSTVGSGYYVKSFNNGQIVFRQSVTVYYAHNSSSSIQLRETSQWIKLDTSNSNPQAWVSDRNSGQNGQSGYCPSPTTRLPDPRYIGYYYNPRYVYGGGSGIWCSKNTSGFNYVVTGTDQNTANWIYHYFYFYPSWVEIEVAACC